jgi:mono/diheme cytochrome c family protein
MRRPAGRSEGRKRVLQNAIKESGPFVVVRHLLRQGLVALVLVGISATDHAANRIDFGIAQARHGEQLFRSRCASCHSLDSRSDEPPHSLRGQAFVERWRSVNDLYGKLITTMPSDKVLSLTQTESLDILAYLLEVNDFKRTGADLTADRARMHEMPVASAATQAGPRSSKAQGYYSEDQAARGEHFFAGSCATCHIAAAKVQKPGDPQDPTFAFVSLVESGGVTMGPIHAKSYMAGTGLLDKYVTVGALEERIRFTMPGHEPNGLDEDTYRDITAYILRLNGFPAGAADLPSERAQLDAMPLVETGFVPLFNGHDFSDFRFLIGMGCTAPPVGCGSVAPGDTFWIHDRSIYTSGYPTGYMYTAGKYLNFVLRLQYRFTANAGAEPEDIYWGNSGYLLFIEQNVVWPKSLEIEGFDVMQLRPLGLATNPTYTYDEEAMKRARRPTGQWNDIEIDSHGGVVRCKLNGTLVSTVTQHEFQKPGFIGFQAENAKIAWRNLRIKDDGS